MMLISYERAIKLVEAIGFVAACAFVITLIWAFMRPSETTLLALGLTLALVIACALLHMNLTGHEPWE